MNEPQPCRACAGTGNATFARHPATLAVVAEAPQLTPEQIAAALRRMWNPALPAGMPGRETGSREPGDDQVQHRGPQATQAAAGYKAPAGPVPAENPGPVVWFEDEESLTRKPRPPEVAVRITGVYQYGHRFTITYVREP